MSLEENDYENVPKPAAQGSSDASESILLREYGTLLRTIEPLRVINRSVFIGLAVLLCLYGSLPLSGLVLLDVTAALASGFWFLQEFLTGRKLGRLGELIAATNAEVRSVLKSQEKRTVVLPPAKTTPGESQTTSASEKETQAFQIPSTSLEQAWTNTYINWRHEAWRSRKLQILQRSEPMIWFLLILAVGAYRLTVTFR